MTKETEAITVTTSEKSSKPATTEKLKAQPAPIFVEAEKMFERLADITRETALKAYEFFQRRGGEWGREIDDWFNAESRILRPVPVEMTETAEFVNVSAAVPGFKPEEIEISVKDNLLVMSGKAEKREEKKDESLVYTEWMSDQFCRQLTLPSVVDAENVKAELRDGILHLTLPKVAAREIKHVAVTAG